MKNARNNDLSDRRIAAAEAKCALLNAFRTARTTDEPARLARQAERATIAAAREERCLKYEGVKREEAERQAAERQAPADAASRVETETREAAERNRIARVIDDEVARKAERDWRYANRKARRT